MVELTSRLSTALADRYRLERHLGEGGMATVYLAEDLKHNRKVAIKVLRPELAAVIGAERFLSEIQTTANLQHPHILPLFDSGSCDSFLFYVMPFVEGESLRDRLAREKQLPIAEAVRIACEVADGLDYAHRHGVVHRDIKPENVLLHDGRVLIADFGIALAASKAGETRMTQTGMSLGTPSYMSPEQAMGDRDIGPQSDVYSLGVMTYELLVGDPPFIGSTAQAIIAKAMTEKPVPPSRLRTTIPPYVEGAVLTALQRLPADRFANAKAMGEALSHSTTTTMLPWSANVPPSRRFLLPAALATAVVALALAAWSWWLRPDPSGPSSRFETTLGAVGALDGIGFGLEAALSPDGSSFVFRKPMNGAGQLYIKHRNEAVAQPLAGTEGAFGPFFSPDGAWIGFVADGEFRRIPSRGGMSVKMAEGIDSAYNRGAWLDDGSIVYYDLTSHTLRRHRADDTAPRVIVTPEMIGGRYPWFPIALPDSRGVLFTAHLTGCLGNVSCRPSRVYLYDARQDSVRLLFEDAIGAWYVPTGHVLYLTSSGNLMATSWDNDRLAPSGKSVPVLDGIQAPGFVVSNDGTAYYLLGRPIFASGPNPNAALVWVDRSGVVTPVDSSWQVNTGGHASGSKTRDWGIDLSPDGQRIALTLLTELGTDIWIKQLPTGPVSRLTMNPGVDRSPAWSRDGRSLTFISDRPHAGSTADSTTSFAVWEQSVDGAGEATLLWAKDAPTDAFRSADGRWLVLATEKKSDSASQDDILASRPGTDSVAAPLMATEYDERSAVLSPDSRWIAYVSNSQGADEVFVRPFPNVGSGRWQVSLGGGTAPLWAHNGHELFFVANGKMNVATVHASATFSSEPPRPLFTIPPRVRVDAMMRGAFTITPDDQRFLMVQENSWGQMTGTPTLVVAQGFFHDMLEKLKHP